MYFETYEALGKFYWNINQIFVQMRVKIPTSGMRKNITEEHIQTLRELCNAKKFQMLGEYIMTNIASLPH